MEALPEGGQIFGGGDHDYLPHHKKVLGGDDHDIVPHGLVGGGRPHGPRFGGDGHDINPFTVKKLPPFQVI